MALARMKDLGTVCRDVRTREVGIQEIHHKVRPDEVRSSLPFEITFALVSGDVVGKANTIWRRRRLRRRREETFLTKCIRSV